MTPYASIGISAEKTGQWRPGKVKGRLALRARTAGPEKRGDAAVLFDGGAGTLEVRQECGRCLLAVVRSLEQRGPVALKFEAQEIQQIVEGYYQPYGEFDTWGRKRISVGPHILPKGDYTDEEFYTLGQSLTTLLEQARFERQTQREYFEVGRHHGDISIIEFVCGTTGQMGNPNAEATQGGLGREDYRYRQVRGPKAQWRLWRSDLTQAWGAVTRKPTWLRPGPHGQ